MNFLRCIVKNKINWIFKKDKIVIKLKKYKNNGWNSKIK